jgi:hypothetical protein
MFNGQMRVEDLGRMQGGHADADPAGPMHRRQRRSPRRRRHAYNTDEEVAAVLAALHGGH